MVTCPNCRHENPADARFCSQCGVSLITTCPVCSHPTSSGDRFCSNCGSPLEPPQGTGSPGDDLSRYLPEELLAKMRSAREGKAMLGERRTVTMLFADITGSTAAADRLDPEDWAQIMNGAFEHLIAPVYRYEGTLAQLRGDAILAFFGAPIAHEDDPVRAVRAGIEMAQAMERYSERIQEDWGMPVEVRVGINTGLVVVGEMGSDLRVEYSALGDAINVAARMEQTAAPGTVRVTRHTLSLTGGVFAVESLGGVEVKGKPEPVEAYRVLEYIGDTERGDAPTLVGRDPELALLDSLATRLMGGSGWITSVIAEGGVGKSRLIDEFRHRVGAVHRLKQTFGDEGDLAWLSGESRSYDSSNPFATVRSMLRGWWGMGRSGGDIDVVRAANEAVGISDPDVTALLSNIGGVTLDDEARSYVEALYTPVLHAKSAEALGSFVEAIAVDRPTIVVIEDLHWADDLSLALIEGLLGSTDRVDLGLVLAMRPYRDEPPWRLHEVADRTHHHRYTSIELAPLGVDESRILLDSLLDDGSLPLDVKETILSRSDGNPLFLEEIVRSLRDDGSSRDLAVPSNLAGILTARLDRLGDEVKYMVQVASVLGSDFDRDTLAFLVGNASAGAHIADLLRKGILVESGGAPGSLAFRHALIQETAYETILRRTRRELHRRVGEYLIETRASAVPDIARHLVESGDLEKAFPYLVEAGRQASRSMALADAIQLLETAVENIPVSADPSLVEAAHETLGESYALVPDLSQASAAYQRLYDYGEEAERPRARVSALNRLGYATAVIGGDLEGANRLLLDAKALAEDAGDEVGLAEYHMNACFVASLAGQVDTAVAHDEATVELGEKSGVRAIYLSGLVRRAMNYVALVDLEQAVPALEAAMDQAGDGPEESIALLDAFGKGLIRYFRGDLRGALEAAEKAQPTLERFSSFYMAMNQRNAGGFLYEMGDLEGAMARFVEAVRLGTKLGQHFVAGSGSSGLSLAYATVGMTDVAEEHRARAVASVGNPMGEFVGSTTWADLGFASLWTGDYEGAVSDFGRGLAVSSTTQHMEKPRLLTGQVLAKLRVGDLEAAEASLHQAWAYVRERSYLPPQSMIGYAEGLFEAESENLPGAERALETAQRVAMELGQSLVIAQIQIARARVADMRRDTEAATTHSDSALAAVEAIAESIADDDLRESFLSNWLQVETHRGD